MAAVTVRLPIIRLYYAKELEARKQTLTLLPPPYHTQCFDYGEHKLKGKSKSDCIVRHMQRLESDSVYAMQSGFMGQ